jgi:hypothetical protein
MKHMNKHRAALAALLVLLLVGWIASYPMIIGMNTFGVILGRITLLLLCVASVVVALYFAGQGKEGLGRVIAVGVGFAAAFFVADALFAVIQRLLMEGGVPEAIATGVYSLLRCVAWVFFFWLAIGRLTRREEKASNSSKAARRTVLLVIACILAAIPLPSIPTATALASPLLPLLMDFFGLLVWWFLTVACIWRFSFGVVAKKNTLGEVSPVPQCLESEQPQ